MKEQETEARGAGQTRAGEGRGRPPVWCQGCGAQVRMLTAFDAAVAAGVSSYTIYRWAEGGAVHYGVTARGVLLVCPNSLARRGEV